MKAFISYSHKDEIYVDDLRNHLAQIIRDGILELWHDREIYAGSDLSNDIENQLEKCDLFLAIVSPDFISSNYCYDVEMTTALDRHAKGTMRVVPIIVEPCEWKRTPLKDLKGLPKDNLPISEWENSNSAYLHIATELRRILESSDDDATQAGRGSGITRFRTYEPSEVANAKAFESGRVLFGTFLAYMAGEEEDESAENLDVVRIYLEDLGVKNIDLSRFKLGMTYEEFHKIVTPINTQLWGKGGKLGLHFENAMHIVMAFPNEEKFRMHATDLEIPGDILGPSLDTIAMFAAIKEYYGNIIYERKQF